MGIKEVAPYIGLFIAVLALFIPSFISGRKADKTLYNQAASPLLNKLLIEKMAIKNGSYPFKTIKEEEVFRLFSFVSKRKRKNLERAYQLYCEAHASAVTSHLHDDHHSGNVTFVNAFVIKNADEVLKKMKPFENQLTK
ncbi:hypothetical protein [Pantoea ananatis]|uniref:hypothetical protein n=1 Tax=Pantoea ananas TaxID=553 RepID=UPI00234FD8D7|nr:hypothetical protein [Pantoea ananatis]MDC7862231.1 hypothetical protein [Pantoea ananatis]